MQPSKKMPRHGGRRAGSGRWLTYNLPPLHLVNYDSSAEAWKEGGAQRMGTFKGMEPAGPGDPNSASHVVRRHLSATSPSPLYQRS